MRVISYNVNGIRAALTKGFVSWLEAANPDILCLQEIKVHEDQLDKEVFSKAGYPFQYWFPAEKKGYSGVAILSKMEPKNVVIGTGITSMDREGRNVRADFEGFSVMSMYLPSGTSEERLDFKLNYMDEFKEYAIRLRKEFPNLVICGDYNICHEPIDIHDPIRLKTVSGFLPIERTWLTQFINTGFVDSFRYLHPEVQQYSWWSYRQNARANNKGWRLDYHMVSETLKDKISRAIILQEAKHSDHCPVLLELDI
jgi:exodeoxyribonuclease III